MSMGRGVTKMAVGKMILQETGTYNAMFQRPYQTHLDGTTLGNIVNRVEEYGSGKISGALLSGVASNLLAPVATPGAEVIIPGGWSDRRIRFIMEVHCEFNTGSYMIYYLQGYTNYPGVTMNGNIAPDMEFIVNSVIGVTRVNTITPAGMQTRDVICESSQILSDEAWRSPVQQHETKYVMRPQDVFNGMHSMYLQEGYKVADNGQYLDARSMLRRDPVRSSRGYNISSNYVAKVIDSYNTGMALNQYGQSDQDIIAASRQQTAEANLAENPVIRAISGFRSNGITNRFTWNELEGFDPNVRHVTNFVTLGQTHQTQVHSAGQTAYWNSSDRSTVVATILSQAVPAMMMDLMISKIVFRSTNHDIGGFINTVIIDGLSMTTADMSQYFEIFKTRLEREILNDVTFGNQEPYMLDMQADMFGETWITLTIGNEPMTTFVTPSFCDNLYAPVIAGNKLQYDRVVNDFDHLVNAVTDAVNTRGSVSSYNDSI